MKIVLRTVTDSDADFLYDLLRERTPEQSISHKQMPTMSEHCAFMASNPYLAWYVIETGHHVPVGQVYLTERDEIGVAVCAAFQGHGIGPLATVEIMKLHPRERYLANVAPKNEKSLAMFGSLGFKLIQLTLEKVTPHA